MRLNSLIKFSLFLVFLVTPIATKAQWGAPYADSWINYSQKYVKIQIKEKGLFKIPFSSLPSNFVISNPDNLKLFFRGKEVAVISTDNKSILFYGVPNDGAQDSLLYRPMNNRTNKYSSLFSDKASYFLTVGDSKGLRAKNQSVESGSVATNQVSHIADDVQLFTKEYSLSTSTSIYPKLMNSFYENSATKTGPRISKDTLMVTSLVLNNFVSSSGNKPTIELLFNGRSYVSRNIEVYLGSSKENLHLAKTLPIVEFESGKVKIDVDVSDISKDNRIYLAYKSSNNNFLERYSLAYLELTYNQQIEMKGYRTKTFHFVGDNSGLKRIAVNGAPALALVYDVTDITNPVFISANASDFLYRPTTKARYDLLVTDEISTISDDQIAEVTFIKLNPSASNFLIISNEEMFKGANKYAAYRASVKGGAYRPLVVKIKDIYNQFNYGEPSPLAIRRFVDYMLSDGNKDKYLFIIGKATAYFERRPADLEGDVPTVGYPGSDVLLVDGLAGEQKDIPSIPVGRIGVFTDEQLDSYLEKVEDYEHNEMVDFGWKKNILHLNGGKTVSEITSFKDELHRLSTSVQAGPVGGMVTAFVKQSLIEVEKVNITNQVNNGVGMISYVGHGATTVTDLDFGYVTDVEKGYDNKGKYPLLYYNGCGVGNIFTGRYNTNLTSPEKIPISLDWIAAKQKGAIAVIANTFESYAGPSIKYLEKLYETIYTDSDADNLSIGLIQQRTARKVLTGGASTFDIANVHQSLLQGDPTLKLIRSSLADYSVNPDNAILISSNDGLKTLESTDSIKVRLIISNLGKNIKDQPVNGQLKVIGKSGVTKTYLLSSISIPYQDTIVVKIPNPGREMEGIELNIDPENLIKEITKGNNLIQLGIDWNVASSVSSYSPAIVKDIIAPRSVVSFNNVIIENGMVFEPNPLMKFQISDDRLINVDTSMVEVYIKRCNSEDCQYKRVSLSGKNNLLKISEQSFVLEYTSTDIGSGAYQLWLVVRDNAANVSNYKISFAVAEERNLKPTLVASPNPMSSYVKFNAVINKNIDQISTSIYDVNGILKMEIDGKPERAEYYDWYWSSGNLPNGLYIYKVIFKSKGEISGTSSGKLVINR